MKRWLAPIALVITLAAGAGPAIAAPPTPVDPNQFQIACPGQKHLDAQLSGKGGLITLPGGRLISISPNQRITLTGPSGTATYVITGTIHLTPLADGGYGVTATGRNTIIVPDANGHPPGLFLTQGTFSWTLNSDFSERTLFSGNGTVTDVCQLLAP